MKRKLLFTLILAVILISQIPLRASATSTDIDAIITSMSTIEKIAQMIMPSFRWSCESMSDCNVTTITTDIENILAKHSFAGVILFAENITGTEQTTRFIDALQKANSNNPHHNSQLLIAVDQEGGYVTRLAYGTNMPGNMALGATNDPSYAYNAAKVIGEELTALGFNTNFAPVSDINNNPANPIIGVRSFSDDPATVGTFATSFMQGLQSQNIITSLKHFPGHGDTSTDTHTSMTVVDKSYTALQNMELYPFQQLIDNGTDMIMTAHIQYPQLETTTYTSISTGETINLPATLSHKIIHDVLRTDMGYDGVVVTDALDMGAIAAHFDKLDSAVLAINAGVDILLMPVETNGTAAINALDAYIADVAAKVDNGDIDINNVDSSVRRILNLKASKGLLAEYQSDIENKVAAALATVSTKENHNKEFEIAKRAITLIKNNNTTLPINAENKTLILYYYGSHRNAANYILDKLVQDNVITSRDNIKLYSYVSDLSTIQNELPTTNNIIIINAMYGLYGDGAFDSAFSQNISDLIDLAHQSNTKVTYLSTQLPYDIARFNTADAIVATYLANGLSFDLTAYADNIPKYGANVLAGLYQLFDQNADLTGKLPVNIFALDDNLSFSDAILYPRGHGLTYAKSYPHTPNTGTATATDLMPIGDLTFLISATVVSLISLFLYAKRNHML